MNRFKSPQMSLINRWIESLKCIADIVPFKVSGIVHHRGVQF